MRTAYLGFSQMHQSFEKGKDLCSLDFPDFMIIDSTNKSSLCYYNKIRTFMKMITLNYSPHISPWSYCMQPYSITTLQQRFQFVYRIKNTDLEAG